MQSSRQWGESEMRGVSLTLLEIRRAVVSLGLTPRRDHPEPQQRLHQRPD